MNTPSSIPVTFSVTKVRADFPILSQSVNGKPIVYFDSGATAQKPKQVIDAIHAYYSSYNANIHRGVHHLSQVASAAYENARKKVQKHLNAADENEIIFTAGTTASVNLIAEAFLRSRLNPGDEVVITGMEHHSNILPWQQVCHEKNAILKVVAVNDDGSLDMNHFASLLNSNVKLVSCTHVSNTLGTINPVKEITSAAHALGIPVFIDGAQAVPHMKVDVQEIGCDFYAFSGHKVYGPTGIGVCYVKQSRYNEMTTWQTGGGTIKTVTFEKTEYVDGPLKYEAGTPNIEGAIGLGFALDYMNAIGMDVIAAHEHELLVYTTQRLHEFDNVEIIGSAEQKAGVISFNVKGVHPFDVGTILDQQGIAVRTGHHCTQPLMQRYNVPGTVRVSFGVYNTKDDSDRLIAALEKAIKMLS